MFPQRHHMELTGTPDPVKVMEMLSEINPERREKMMNLAMSRFAQLY